MPNESIDPETLAALLEGRLSPDERERVLAELARKDEAFDDLVEASALLGELPAAGAGVAPASPPPPEPSPEPSSEPSPVVSLAERRRVLRSRGLYVAAPLLAAGLAFVMLTGRPRSGAEDGPVRSARAAAEAAGAAPTSVAGTFGADWDRPAWSVTRGAESSLPPDALAFRMGARLTQLEVAFVARDTAAISDAAAALARLAGGVDAGAPAAARVEQLAARGADATSADRESVARELRALADTPVWFDLGAWTDAARLAARSGQTAFFAQDGPAMAELRRVIGELDALPAAQRAPAAASLEGLHTIAARRTTGPSDLPAVAAALDATMQELGR